MGRRYIHRMLRQKGKESHLPVMTGYQAGILYSIGCWSGDRYTVRSIDRWYCDAVQPLFGTKVHPIKSPGRDKTQYQVKSKSVSGVDLSSVDDPIGFCRAYVEIHGIIDYLHAKTRKGKPILRLRLRIFGDVPVLEQLMVWLPAAPKKLQAITNRIGDKYIGSTYALYYQSKSEIMDILDYISGTPRNDAVWALWETTIKEEQI